MGQREILELLKNTKRFMTPKEISKKMGLGLPSVHRCLTCLYLRGEILKRAKYKGKVQAGHTEKEYKYV